MKISKFPSFVLFVVLCCGVAGCIKKYEPFEPEELSVQLAPQPLSRDALIALYTETNALQSTTIYMSGLQYTDTKRMVVYANQCIATYNAERLRAGEKISKDLPEISYLQ